MTAHLPPFPGPHRRFLLPASIREAGWTVGSVIAAAQAATTAEAVQHLEDTVTTPMGDGHARGGATAGHPVRDVRCLLALHAPGLDVALVERWTTTGDWPASVAPFLANNPMLAARPALAAQLAQIAVTRVPPAGDDRTPWILALQHLAARGLLPPALRADCWALATGDSPPPLLPHAFGTYGALAVCCADTTRTSADLATLAPRFRRASWDTVALAVRHPAADAAFWQHLVLHGDREARALNLVATIPAALRDRALMDTLRYEATSVFSHKHVSDDTVMAIARATPRAQYPRFWRNLLRFHRWPLLGAVLAAARPSQLRNLTRADLEPVLLHGTPDGRAAAAFALGYVERPAVPRAAPAPEAPPAPPTR